MMKRICEALDIEATLTLKDKSEDVPNPMTTLATVLDFLQSTIIISLLCLYKTFNIVVLFPQYVLFHTYFMRYSGGQY